MESALVQTLIALAIVLGAAAFLVRRAWRSVGAGRRASTGEAPCGTDGGCGCSAAAPAGTDSLESSRRA